MKKKEYIEIAKNPWSWFRIADIQKQIGDKLLDLTHKDNSISNHHIMINAHFHYGIGIENGLKGLIVKNDPTSINFSINGEQVVLKTIGGRNINHNLLTLARDASIFDMTVYKYDSDIKSLKIVLSHLSDAIKWLPKYPVPRNNNSMFIFDGSIPTALVYGYHILDVMQPLFDLFKKEAEEYIPEARKKALAKATATVEYLKKTEPYCHFNEDELNSIRESLTEKL